MSKPVQTKMFPSPISCLFTIFILHAVVISSDGFDSFNGSLNVNSQWPLQKIPILHDSSSTDSDFQRELLQSALLTYPNADESVMQPIDLAHFRGATREERLLECVKSLLSHKFKVGVSLLEGSDMSKLVKLYDNEISGDSEHTQFHIYTPRSYFPQRLLHAVKVKSLQMNEEARALTLLNRVKKVGVDTLIPIVDGDNESQQELLKLYHKIGLKSKYSVKFTRPISLNDPTHLENLQLILQEHTGFHENHLSTLGYHSSSFQDQVLRRSGLKPGVLLLSTNASYLAMQIASEKKHLLMSWFSPNIMEYEEWTYNQTSLSTIGSIHKRDVNRMSDSSEAVDHKAGQQYNSLEGATANNSLFGLYTVNFAGSKGWDNPIRRNMLREFTAFTGPSPRILHAVLAYDAASLARDHLQHELKFPKVGLSGQIDFNKWGFRKSGTFLGTSSTPKTQIPQVALLQSSTWILEDAITVKESSIGGHTEISDYDIATSSILTRNELLHIANSTRNEVGCKEHLLSIVTYDPFSQMPYHYFFNEANLPNTLVVPNHHGFGITFACTHFPDENEANEKDGRVSTLQLACTPGLKMTHPISCFRSHLNKRQKRATVNGREAASGVPSVQYQYSLSGNDPWLSQSPNNYFYQSALNRDYSVEPFTYSTPAARLDITAAASEEPPAPTPPAPPPTSKLPELRQILKATKPFVGSCIGSSTGCAICVLVLGRLPLGTAPTACTGPCFVGTFGTCGSLLGRVFAETTVICTELFQQGLLDADTFVADAEFGRHMLDSSPYTLHGYTLLATPLVTMMKSSSLVTNVVATFALPWAHHMKYLLGRSNETNTIGSIVHLVGYPLCNLTGRLYFFVVNLKTNFYSYIFLLSPLLSSLLTILLILMLVPSLSSSKVSLNKLFSCVVFCTVVSKVKQVSEKVCTYFKAIGRST